MQQVKKIALLAVISVAALWAGWLTYVVVDRLDNSPTQPESFSSTGGGSITSGGGGHVTLDSDPANLSTGAGTVASPLLTKLFLDSPLTGTGTTGNHLGLSMTGGSCSAGQFLSALSSTGTGTCTGEVGDISSVIAGTGLSGGASSGAATLNVNIAGASCSAGQAVTTLSSTGTGSCSTFVDTAGTSLSLSGHTLNVNLPVTTCAIGKVVTAIASDGTVTCGPALANDPLGTHFEYVDDWLMSVCANTNSNGITVCDQIFSVYDSGTATNWAGITGGTTRPGIFQGTTGSTSSGRAMLMSDTFIDFSQYTTMEFDWVGGWETLSDGAAPTDAYATFIGFGDNTSTVNENNGCGFYYDRANVITSGANSGNVNALECYCAANSARTVYLINGSGNSDESFPLGTATVAAASLPNTNIYSLRVKVTGTTRAEFFYDGTKVCDINTHIPSGSSQMTAVQIKHLKNAGTNARTIDMDWTRLKFDLSVARTDN